MNFRTELHPTPAAYKLNQTAKVVTVGSCFSDVIGRQLERYKIETLTNPFGTIFNPLSACKLLQVCAGADVELADSFVQNNGRWYSYDFHSSFSAETEEELYEMLDEVVVLTRRFLKKADVLVLTLGTANIFRLNITGETVANCHKLPAQNFTRETLLPEEIITCIAETHSLLRELNPNLKLVLTVSPVRHLKDTLELNSVSKSVLRLATHFLTESLPDITYFPAYELLLDDLRDYRFYKEDMLHPTAVAEQYIWEKFTSAYFEISFKDFTQEWDKILRAKEHKPFQPESAQHQSFIQNTLEKLRALQSTVNVTDEIAYFENQVIITPEPVEEPDSEEEDEEEIETANRASKFLDGLATETVSETTEKPELAEAFAVAAVTSIPSLAEDGLIRKKKKKKKKKKRPAQTTEGVSLAEVGTTREPDFVKTEDPITEAIAEVTDVLATPEHPLEHYGETLSEAPAEQVRPILPAKSKSAKRRESRKKKKALSATENAFVPETSDELAALLQPNETSITGTTFSAENPTVSKAVPEPTTNPEIEMEPVKPGKRPVKARNDRNKKKTFPDLFAAEASEPTSADVIPSKAESEGTIEPSAPMVNSEIEVTPVVVKVKKPTVRKDRKPKKAEIQPAVASPITETIAVPFMPAREMGEATEIPTPKVEPKKKGRTVQAIKPEKPTKPAKNKPTKAADLPKKATENGQEKAKPKPTNSRKKTVAETPATDSNKEPKTPKKPGRKKKVAPEM